MGATPFSTYSLPMCDLCEKCVVEVDRLPILPEDPRHNIVQMIRPRLLKLPAKPLDANNSLCRKCRDDVEHLRGIFTSLCECAEVVAPTPLTLWPGAKATIATSRGRSKQGTTDVNAPQGGATPQFCTPTIPPTNCWPEAPWGGGGGGGGGWRGGSGRCDGGGGGLGGAWERALREGRFGGGV